MIQASLKAAGFLALTLWAGSAAAYDTGNELHAAFNDPDLKHSARMYVKGVGDGLLAGYVRDKLGSGATSSALVAEAEKRMLGCMSDAVTLGQLTDVVQKYLNDNPAERHLNSSLLVMLARLRAFPCKP